MPDLAPDFIALRLDDVSAAALARAKTLGSSNASLRIERTHTQLVALRDGVVQTTADDIELGVGLRVVRDGAVGFAATAELEPSSSAGLADHAVAMARLTAKAGGRVELADEPPHGEANWVSEFRIDPTEVPLSEKVGILEQWSRRLLDAGAVDHVTAHVLAVSEDKYYADDAGTVVLQRRVRIQPQVEVHAVEDSGGFESVRTTGPPAGRGWEYLHGEGWDFEREINELPSLLEEKVNAPSVDPGSYDLVIDPTNLWLTIHESVGHATELDRALGYEAAYAGTSFATIDKLGKLKYGSELMHVTGDRTTPYGLATVGYDDEGVSAQAFDIVRDGVLVGYQLDRTMARANGFGRSNGCAYADSAMHIPIQRMPNVSLQPAKGNGSGPSTAKGARGDASDGPSTQDLISGTDRGIYIVGDKSWSIDMQRYNFQFTGQLFYRIEGGRLAGQVKDVAYQSSTLDFWGSLDALGGASTYVLGGAFNCGKGQPAQVAPVSHGCPSARFRQVNVLNTRAEAGR
ncbi:MAG TPA: TldD/PmbA family protein [Acidimicrobiales bacterium]|nr:TldD/PmbA family protein [Acidimicrobiales bacterium]